jgi:hypothetical protein
MSGAFLFHPGSSYSFFNRVGPLPPIHGLRGISASLRKTSPGLNAKSHPKRGGFFLRIQFWYSQLIIPDFSRLLPVKLHSRIPALGAFSFHPGSSYSFFNRSLLRVHALAIFAHP